MKLFEFPLEKCPEIIILGLSQLNITKGKAMADELLSLILPNYLTNNVQSIDLLSQIWKNNHGIIVKGICKIFKEEDSNLNDVKIVNEFENVCTKSVKFIFIGP